MAARTLEGLVFRVSHLSFTLPLSVCLELILHHVLHSLYFPVYFGYFAVCVLGTEQGDYSVSISTFSPLMVATPSCPVLLLPLTLLLFYTISIKVVGLNLLLVAELLHIIS